MRNFVIGLGHYSRTGKDTLANYIVEELAILAPGLTVRKRSFAQKLKEVAHDLYGWCGLQDADFYNVKENEHLRQEKLPNIDLTPVEVWCKLGTDAVRNQVYQNTWSDYLVRNLDDNSAVVIPDVRFPNEVEAIRSVEGVLVKVVRPGYEPLNTTADQALADYDGWDYVVGQSGELSELRDFAGRISLEAVMRMGVCVELNELISLTRNQ